MAEEPTRAKYCPRCSVMSFVDSEACRYCGYRFRSVPDAPVTDETLNRTQMFMLPSLPQRSGADASPPRFSQGRARLIYLSRMLRTAIPILLILLSAALLYWAVASGWLRQ